ncbi:CDP-diacylglycerol--glycerol-3-phosphate 3-phosphatidyltransferase [Dysgonomonas hofstadii]|uniref:CDP-diacylglycerol--glycerol-3-phosphate 3-phosphatidyltransferase n=1 Tax=Dysgonomonas hofstadii TaxID=637886 RepID=A0A840CR23_9BACT|nr:CDP-alcohol phosphatidyltransferase family protein [Dysgonomonas hofstadii]MBB4037501.1 CDP-diacylglycerol--glycerol-3-phosphate 3-phosphatidyltransferase [Dysgonomonas hofstadii]
MKKLPNILSISRLIISGFLFFLGGYPALFTILYLYCGISDVADGYIARRWQAESTLGAKLDSWGDFVFYILITVMFFTHTELMKDPVMLWLVIVLFIIKLLNLIITKIKFHQLGMLHTIGNKLSGLLVYFMLPVYVLFSSIPIAIGIIIASAALIATLEETFIHLTSGLYNPNRKSVFCKPK